jgi:hypothetical protein
MNPLIQLKRSTALFLIQLVLAYFALARLLVAGTQDGVLDIGNTPLARPHPTFITFDAPGSTATFSDAINPAGIIAGGFDDTSGAGHGFVRIP